MITRNLWRDILRHKSDNAIVNLMKKVANLYNRNRWRERTISCGTEYPDKVFYVIRVHNVMIGLFSYFNTCLERINEVQKKGYIPVVDMHLHEENNNPTRLNPESDWEIYFKQPGKYSIKEIQHAKNVVLGEAIDHKPIEMQMVLIDEKYRMSWKNYVHENILVEHTLLRLANDFYFKNMDGNKVVGVLCRGSDYTSRKPASHPIPPSAEICIKKVIEFQNKHKCNKVFLVTEDEDIYDDFKREFKDDLISYQTLRQKHDTEDKYLFELYKNSYNESEFCELNKQYLVSIYLLSKCKVLVSANTSGALSALLFNYEYEEQYIFDLGKYE